MHFTTLPATDKSFRMSAVRKIGAEGRTGTGDRRPLHRIEHERGRALRG